jgi:hypothetical protein
MSCFCCSSDSAISLHLPRLCRLRPRQRWPFHSSHHFRNASTTTIFLVCSATARKAKLHDAGLKAAAMLQEFSSLGVHDGAVRATTPVAVVERAREQGSVVPSGPDATAIPGPETSL